MNCRIFNLSNSFMIYSVLSIFLLLFMSSGMIAQDYDVETKLLASDGAANDFFGYTVSISGNFAIIGAIGDSSYKGAAYIYFFNGSDWIQQQKLTANDGVAWDFFGNSVSVSGNTAIVGCPYQNTSTGAVYVYEFNGSYWTQVQKLTASDGAIDTEFGYSVSISKNRIIVGAEWDNDNGSNSGSAYIFEFDGSSWVEQQKLLANDGAANDYFGTSVSINGNTAIVGAIFDDDNGSASGSAYIYQFNGSIWTQQQKLTASDGAASDRFGVSVSIHGNTAIVGADGDDDNGTSSGSTWIYELIAQPGQVEVADGIYNNRNKITWNNRSGSAESFKIYRSTEEIATTLAGARSYFDYDATAGKIISYGVAAYNSTWGESNATYAIGWQRPNGRIDGSVKTRQNAGVADVEITVSPTNTDINTCLEFDGVDNYVQVNSVVIPPSGNFTVSVWAKDPTVQTGTFEIVSQNAGSGEEFYIGRIVSGNIRAGDDWNDTGVPFPTDGLWHYYTVVKETLNTHLYVDGVLRASRNDFIVNPAGSEFRIARQYGGHGEYFNGLVDELRIWNVARDSLDIATDMHNALKGNEAGLVAYWTFDDSSR
ncbi:MAG: hypothetical protein KAS18_02775, partial [Calditrichia bacterium]|nr:hypothetical protein [Calditrichia bacterium]